MKRKFRITLSRSDERAEYLVSYLENEHPAVVRMIGDGAVLIRKDGSPVNFADTHMDKLANDLQEQAKECGAEGSIEEVTGNREFRLRLEGKDFKADFNVVYHSGDSIPVVSSPGGNADIALPDGSIIPFSKVSAGDLKSFVASMAKTNGLNFEFIDIDD